jgi:hypothetical protein
MKRLKQGKKLANGQRTYSGTEQGKRTQNEWERLPKLGYINHTRNRKIIITKEKGWRDKSWCLVLRKEEGKENKQTKRKWLKHGLLTNGNKWEKTRK